jgi:ribosomal protein S18 acetylase RimI-like enzyme
MEGVIIRPATENEYDEISEIDVTSFTNSEYGKATGLVGDLDAQRARRNNARRMCDRGQTIVALSGGEIIGFITVEGTNIINLAVLSQYRNIGVGTLLVASVDARKVFTAHEPAAVRVYEKAGFTRRTAQHGGLLLERTEDK